MSGYWLKMEHSLPEKPEVLILAKRLHLPVDTVLGKLFRFWRWVDQQVASGVTPFDVVDALDALLDCPGFSAELVRVGWLSLTEQGIEVPHFERHLSQGAKTRGLACQRAEKHRRAAVTPADEPATAVGDAETTPPPAVTVSAPTPYMTAEDREVAEKMRDCWNASCGVHDVLTPNRLLSQKRLWLIHTAREEFPNFEALFYKALAKLPIPQNIGGWQPSFDWMLDVTNCAKLAEGTYDYKRSSRRLSLEEKAS